MLNFGYNLRNGNQTKRCRISWEGAYGERKAQIGYRGYLEIQIDQSSDDNDQDANACSPILGPFSP